MRTLHLDTGRELRGGQIQVLRLVEALGENATLLAVRSGLLLQLAQGLGLDARPFSTARLFSLQRQADIVHAHDARSHTWAAALKPRCLAVSRRVAFPIKRGVFSKWKYAQADHYLAVSGFVKKRLVDFGVCPEKITVVYDGVPLPDLCTPGSNIVALASRDAMKGRDLLAKVQVLLDRPILFSENLERDLPAAAVFVYITRSEGLGSAALLAMAHGVPVVASNVGGLPEVVECGVNGLLTPNDPHAIAEAVRTVLDRRGEMAGAARLTVERRFLSTQMVQGTLDVYQRMLAC